MRLIREPVGDQIEFEDGVPERLLRLTGGHPYYAQTFCQRLVDALNERRTRLASTDVVTHVTDQLLAEPPLPLDDMWSGSTSLQCWVMAELARLLSEPDSAVSADALLVASDHAPTAVVAELRHLTISEILEESAGRYRFPVDFMRQWIRKEQLWWGVAHQHSPDDEPVSQSHRDPRRRLFRRARGRTETPVQPDWRTAAAISLHRRRPAYR